jgi:uncharacterized YigZ family protein
MNPGRYPIPAGSVRVEEEIKRSRFITTLGPAPTTEAARATIAQVSAEFGDASHNCWAYVAGPPGSTREVGMSDDGEPHGTAGRPMLNVLLHGGVGEIVAVVTRYFGGALLGTGGLVRAYSGGVQLALASLATVERVPRAALAVVVDYSAVTPLQRLLPQYEAEILGQEFGADATFHLRLPLEHVAPLTAAVVELTNGLALVEVTQQDASAPVG